MPDPTSSEAQRLAALNRSEDAVDRLVDLVERAHDADTGALDFDAVRTVIRDELANFDPVLDESEQRARTHLLAFMTIVRSEWHLTANQAELSAALNVLHGFVIARMLHRKAPETWSAWYDEDLEERVARVLGDRIREQASGDVDEGMTRVVFLDNWLEADRSFHGPNFAGVTTTTDRESLRTLLLSNPVPGDVRDVTPALADYLIGNLGVCDRQTLDELAEAERGEQ